MKWWELLVIYLMLCLGTLLIHFFFFSIAYIDVLLGAHKAFYNWVGFGVIVTYLISCVVSDQNRVKP
jgi:multidrug transporter EmrE-like cation transporter